MRAYGLTVAEVYQKIAQRLTTTATAQTPVEVDGTTMDVKITNNLDPLTKENMMDMTFDTSVLTTDGETVTRHLHLADIATWETGAPRRTPSPARTRPSTSPSRPTRWPATTPPCSPAFCRRPWNEYAA